MTQDAQPRLIHAPLVTRQQGGVTLFDAVAGPTEGQFDLFFSHDTPVEAIAPGPGLSIDVVRTVNGAPWLSVSLEEGHALSLRLDGVDVMRAPSAPEPAIFAGRDVAFALRNGEPASRVLDWLAYHMRHHAMSGALIISRA